MIEVRTLGAAEIVVGRKRLTPKTEGLFALAVYLCVRAGEPSSRDALCEMFWPGSDPAKARHNLRQMLYRLRQAGIETLEDGDLISVRTETLNVDLRDTLREDWEETASSDAVRAARSFLPHFAPNISEDFQRWLDTTRATVGATFRRAALRQILNARQEARWATLAQWADTLLESDPLSEEGTLARAESIVMTGSKALAIEALDSYVAELGENAPRIGLPATLLRRRIAERLHDWANRACHEIPLVGRSSQMRRLTALIEDARRGSGSSLLLYGAPGIGKSRLCIEATAIAILRGVRVVTVRAEDARTCRPLGLATAMAAQLHDLPGVAGTAPEALAVARRLLDSARLSSHVEDEAGATLSLDHLAWAIGAMAHAAAEEHAVLLHIDDIHNSDLSSLAVLRPLLQLSRAGRIAVLATARSHWLSALSADSRASLPANRLHVPPLTLAESQHFAAAIGQSLSLPLTQEKHNELSRLAGGNPLFIKELAARSVGHWQSGGNVPTLGGLIEERCSLLTARELRLLRLVSLLGPLASIGRVRNLAGTGTATLPDDLESLERDGLLTLDSTNTLRLHDCWRDAIDSDTPRAAKAALAQECAAALEPERIAGVGLEVEWHQGHLFALAGSTKEAVRCYCMSATRLLALGVPAEAAEAFSRARALTDDPVEKARIGVSLANAWTNAGSLDTAAALCREALAEFPRHSPLHADHRAEAVATLAEACWLSCDDVRDELSELASIVTDASISRATRVRCAHMGMRLSCNLDRALAHHFFEAVALEGTSTHDDWMVSATLLVYTAEFGSAADVRSLVRSIAALSATPAQTKAMLLRHCAVALRMIGDYDGATSLSEQAVSLSLASGLPASASVAALGLAFEFLDRNMPSRAFEYIQLATAWSESPIRLDRHTAMRHALTRHLLADGRPREVVELYGSHFDSVRSDVMTTRRANESAVLAMAAALTGQRELSKEALELSVAVVTDATPHWVLDFAAETSIATLVALGESQAAAALRDHYVGRRELQLDRPIVTTYTHLRGGVVQR